MNPLLIEDEYDKYIIKKINKKQIKQNIIEIGFEETWTSDLLDIINDYTLVFSQKYNRIYDLLMNKYIVTPEEFILCEEYSNLILEFGYLLSQYEYDSLCRYINIKYPLQYNLKINAANIYARTVMICPNEFTRIEPEYILEIELIKNLLKDKKLLDTFMCIYNSRTIKNQLLLKMLGLI